MKPETKKLLEEMAKGPYGRAISEFLDYEYDKIKDVSTIPDDADHALEAKARKHALKVIKELFSFMGQKTTGSSKPNMYT